MTTLSNITLRAVLASTVALVLGAWALAIISADLRVDNLGFVAEVSLILTAVVVGIGATYALEAVLRKTDNAKIYRRTNETTVGLLLLCALFDAFAVVLLFFVTSSAAAIRCFV
ncbi:MAG: hypothetical protein Q8P13_02725 [bacterium]|nr:hypothetical protein [bacterium]